MNIVSLALPVLLAFCFSLTNQVLGAEVSFPQRFRTEGKLKLQYSTENSTLEQHLVFSESIDTNTSRSAITIGYVLHLPVKYIRRDATNTLVVDDTGSCRLTATNESYFIPEINWFISALLPGLDIGSYAAKFPHHMGPTGLLKLMISLGGAEFEFSSEEVYRNIKCKVYTKKFRLENKPYNIQIDAYLPISGVVFHNVKINLFAIKVKVVQDQSNQKEKESGFSIDYYNIDAMEAEGGLLDHMQYDFDVPTGVGCSRFLPMVYPVLKTEFSFFYLQQSSSKYNMIAYDYTAGLLRKETIDESVDIWDLKRDLLYHINSNASQVLNDIPGFTQTVRACSVIKTQDERLSPAYRPAKSLSWLTIMGVNRISYMGQGTVRNLPSIIYETILNEPPSIFGFTEEELDSVTNDNREYIVQFHFLKNELTDGRNWETWIDSKAFWPAQINLYRRWTDSNNVDLMDKLDIFDFHWSLDGWDKKSAELFQVSECYSVEEERVRLNLEVAFNTDQILAQKYYSSDILLKFNKFRLEYALIRQTMDALNASILNLVDYQLQLRLGSANLELVIADRSQIKLLTYYGTGGLPDENSYKDNRIIIERMSEDDCVRLSSNIESISLVIHCPEISRVKEDKIETCYSSCIAIYGENEPMIKAGSSPTALGERTCHAYRLTSKSEPQKATPNVNKNINSLLGLRIEFWVHVPEVQGVESESQIELVGSIKDYDLVHDLKLITIVDYRYTLDSEFDDETIRQATRSIDSITYESSNDCARVCNLDVSCRSYSFCKFDQQASCILSKLDIREYDLPGQLVYISPSFSKKDNLIAVTGKNDRYKLKFQNWCSIYERDYLNMFSRTNEIVMIPLNRTAQFATRPSTAECAKLTVDKEQKNPKIHAAMFIYCPSKNENLCLMDENLIEPIIWQPEAANLSSDENNLNCHVYRKKFQTYFNASAKVFKRSEGIEQLALNLSNVEQCARACWTKFGQVCASFDYEWTSGECLINRVKRDAIDSSELEFRSGWLHYERDLRYDDIRNLYSMGQHQPFIEPPDREQVKKTGFLMKAFTFILTIASFLYGLVLGRKLNERQGTITVERQSGLSEGASPQASTSKRDTVCGQLNDSSDYQVESEDIMLNVIKNRSEDNQPLVVNF